MKKTCKDCKLLHNSSGCIDPQRVPRTRIKISVTWLMLTRDMLQWGKRLNMSYTSIGLLLTT